MFYQTEAKPQGWRALAVFEDGSECLLYVGRSTRQVREGYKEAYKEVLTEEERAQVKSISMQCWEGAPDRGRWLAKQTLPKPDAAKLNVFGKSESPAFALAGATLAAGDDAEASSILPFRRAFEETDDESNDSEFEFRPRQGLGS